MDKSTIQVVDYVQVVIIRHNKGALMTVNKVSPLCSMTSHLHHLIFVHVLDVLVGSGVDLQGLGVVRHLSVDVLLQDSLQNRRDPC